MKTLLSILLLSFFCLNISAQMSNGDKANTVKKDISLLTPAPNDISQTAKYLNRSANFRIYSLGCLAAGGAYIGIMSGVEFGLDSQKNRAIGIGAGVFGAGAVACFIADLVYYKKAAKAAKMEIRPSGEGLGLSLKF